MRVELGNPVPHERIEGALVPQPGLDGAPAVTYVNFPEGDDQNGNPLYTVPDEHDDGLLPDHLSGPLGSVPEGEARDALRRTLINGHLNDASGAKGFPDREAFVAVVHPNGLWANMAGPGTSPTWVWSDNKVMQKLLAQHYGCAEGRPDGWEDTHWTQYGALVYPPGAQPDPVLGGVVALHTNAGRDIQAIQMGGVGYLGASGTATATSATSLTGSAESGASHASNDSVGQVVYAGPNNAGTGSTTYGVITANTSGTTPVYTVDRWYLPEAPGGAAATTPNATAKYQVVSGSVGTLFVGLTADSTAPAATDTTLPSEITTSGGGLIRKICPLAHTAGAATWTATPVFTANGSDSLPVTIAKAGYSISLTSGFKNSYQTLVSPTATLSASGDQLTITWTFTMT